MNPTESMGDVCSVFFVFEKKGRDLLLESSTCGVNVVRIFMMD